MERLTDRRDFLRAAKALSAVERSVVLQAVSRLLPDERVRVGFTCTKKLGNAVIRNRIRRRMKEAARLVLPALAKPGYDYVLIGRAGTRTRAFDAIQKDIISALTKIHRTHTPQ
jgi:ribonuclease P protein component